MLHLAVLAPTEQVPFLGNRGDEAIVETQPSSSAIKSIRE